LFSLKLTLLGTIILVLSNSGALSEKRVALVIGNSAYQNVARLTNPVGDAAAMTALFKNANFDVVDSRTDLPVAEMRRALRDFGAKARDSDIAVIYYAGHGIELDGMNYLIPVDAQLETDTDVFDETLALDRVLVAIEPAKQLRLVILDACRDNPFSKAMKRTIGSRSIGRGLAKVEPSNPNTMIAFAAKAGFTALDGDTKNSPFAVALTSHLTTPGLDLRKAFGFVRDDVLKATSNKQEPFIYGSLGGNDLALVPAPAVVAQPANAAPDLSSIIRRDYELAERVGTREAWDFFLSTYSDGFYAKLAQAQRNKLAAEEVRLAATEKARLAAEERSRLAAEGAKASEQARAAAQAKAAEEARIASEKKKALEEAKVAVAERAKAAAQAKATEDARIAAETAKAVEEAKAVRERVAAEKKKAFEDAKVAEADRVKAALQAKADENAQLAGDKAKPSKAEQADAKISEQQKAGDDRPIGPAAALTTPDQVAPKADPPPAAAYIPRLLQIELRRLGCNTGPVDGNWNTRAQKSLEFFNKSTGMKLDVKIASLDTLQAVRSRPGRVCPLSCDPGYRIDGDRCIRITCAPGTFLNRDNECEKKHERDKSAKREGGSIKPDRQEPLREPKTTSSFSCTQMTGKCGIVCAAKTGRTDCASTVCVRLREKCMSTGCWMGRGFSGCGLVRQ
jgi:uncharacterized caspase-like protein